MSDKKPLFVFFGTPHISVRVLEQLELKGMLPALVVTAPGKPQGRGLDVAKSPVHKWAESRGIDVLTPTTLKDESFVAELANTDWDVFVVAMYAKLIPKNILDLPRRGCLNVHPSLLPKFRGPSPVLSAILADERVTGVSVMLLEEKMDAGPVVAQGRIELDAEDWPPQGSMFEELLAQEGGTLLAETMVPWIAGEIEPAPQNESLATYTKKFTDTDALLRQGFAGHAPVATTGVEGRENFLKIRAFDKSPRAYFMTERRGTPIRVIVTDADFVDGVLQITRVIPEGKKEMDYADFMRGLSPQK